MEAADDDWNFRLPKRSRDIKGARVLVRLNTDEPNKAEITVTPDASKERRHVDTGVRLIDRLNVNFGPKDSPLRAVGSDTVDGSERIRGDHRAPPADHVSVVVVMGRFDQDKLESPGGRHLGLEHNPSLWLGPCTLTRQGD